MTHEASRPMVTEQVAVGRLVAGLDLLLTSEREADGVAHALGRALGASDAEAVTIASHWARLGEMRHVALSVGVEAISEPALLALLAETAETSVTAEGRPDGSVGLLLGQDFRGASELRASAAAAVAAHSGRSSGRVTVFPGSDALAGTVTVGEILASAIDRVRVLGGGDADPATMVNTRDFLRPRWEGGALVLHTQAALGGTLVPFETPYPTPCCAVH